MEDDFEKIEEIEKKAAELIRDLEHCIITIEEYGVDVAGESRILDVLKRAHDDIELLEDIIMEKEDDKECECCWCEKGK